MAYPSYGGADEGNPRYRGIDACHVVCLSYSGADERNSSYSGADVTCPFHSGTDKCDVTAQEPSVPPRNDGEHHFYNYNRKNIIFVNTGTNGII